MSNAKKMVGGLLIVVVSAVISPLGFGNPALVPSLAVTHSVQGVSTGRFAALGDSLTDEYEVAEGAVRSFARNWLEQLHDSRGLDLGAFSHASRGTPRNQGYENNWARAGATTETMLSEGQHTGVAAQLAGGQINWVFLMIGNNDFGFNYSWIYDGGDWTAFVGNAADRVQLAVDTVLNADPNVKLILATVPDWEMDPWYRQTYQNAAKRQNVRSAMAEYNRQIRRIAASSPRIALADVYQLSLTLLDLPKITIGGCEIKNDHWSDDPTTLIMGDHIHPGSVASGLIANEFIKAMNQFGAGIDVLSDYEILSNAGLFLLQATVTAGSGSVSPQAGAYTEGTTVTLTATPQTGYRVKKWTGTDNDSSTTQMNSVTMTSDKTVTVEFETIPVAQFTLTTSVAGGHGSLSPKSGAYTAGVKISLAAIPDSGYQVKRWIGTDKDGSTASTNLVTMDADRNVTVEFEPIPPARYTLSADVKSGQGTITPDSGTYDAGAKVTLTAIPAEGYCLRRWTGTDDDASSARTTTVTMNANRRVTVEFACVQYHLDAHVVGSHGLLIVVPINGTYNAGTKVTLTACPEEMYHVKRWAGTDDDSCVSTGNTVTLMSDRTVTVEFERKPFNVVTKVVGGHGALSPGDGSHAPGIVVPLTATPDPGYCVKKWTGTNDDKSTANANEATADSDKTVSVEFEKITFQLTANVAGGHGTVSPIVCTYEQGRKVTLSAAAESRYRVKKWTGTDDDTSVAAANTVTMTSDKTVTVEFELAAVPLYQLTIRVKGGNGTLTPDGGRYPAGTVVKLSASPDEEYCVKCWAGTDNDACTAEQNTVVMTADKTVGVEFMSASTDPADGDVTGKQDTSIPGLTDVNPSCSQSGMLLISLIFLAGLGLTQLPQH